MVLRNSRAGWLGLTLKRTNRQSRNQHGGGRLAAKTVLLNVHISVSPPSNPHELCGLLWSALFKAGWLGHPKTQTRRSPEPACGEAFSAA
jgi:hypothetical protein